MYNYNFASTRIRIEWDPLKNLANQRKHNVSFEVASQIFRDPFFVAVPDRVVDQEQRWQASGCVKTESGKLLLLLVAHTFWEIQEDGATIEVIRIISARPATKRERQHYEKEN